MVTLCTVSPNMFVLSVCLFVGNERVLWKNGWLDQDAIRVVGRVGQEWGIRWGPAP